MAGTGIVSRDDAMTFLQPFILYGLPLALLPLVIHLLNRMRYRSVKWAAMAFLIKASRASTRYAKLRQILILLCRVTALLALVLAVARPLAGGWLGWMLSPKPDTILILLDRSASMETKDPRTQATKREQALKLITDAARDFAESSRFVLVENATHQPQEVATVSALTELAATNPSDTSADLPAMLQSAADWLAQNKTGLTEIWIASDLQRTNWQPDNERWRALTARLAAIPQGVRVRLLALNQRANANASVAITDVIRRDRAGQSSLKIVIDTQRTDAAPAKLPLAITFNGARSQIDAQFDGQTARIQHTLPLNAGRDAYPRRPQTLNAGSASNDNSAPTDGSESHPYPASSESGWGKIELPADANARDNAAFFVYGPRAPLRAALVAPDGPSRRVFQAAIAPSPKLGVTCEIIGEPSAAEWQKFALVVWQLPVPRDAELIAKLQNFVESGGVLVFFPNGQTDAQSFAGAAFGAIENAPAGTPFRVVQWDEHDGPVAKSDEGLSLPVPELSVSRRQQIAGEKNAWASFADAQPLLTHRALGKGQVLFCATLPEAEWSSLGDGRVLVPVLQRLLQRGGARFNAAMSITTNDAVTMESPASWSSVDSEKPKDIRFDAGVYRNGARLIAVNRPAGEDIDEVIEASAAKQLFEPLSVQLLEEKRSAPGALQGEIWRGLLVAMLIVLLAESVLTLPLQKIQSGKVAGMISSEPPDKNLERAA